jgi:hypothetical protein
MQRIEISAFQIAIATLDDAVREAATGWLEHVLDHCREHDIEPVLYGHMGDWQESAFTMPDDADAVLITGDMLCGRYVDDRALSENTLLLVTGNLKATALISGAAFVVAGQVNVDFVYVSSGNDFQLFVGGNLSASKAVIEDGQNIVCAGIIASPLIISLHNEISAAQIICRLHVEHSVNVEEYFLADVLEFAEETHWDGEALTLNKTGKIVASLNANSLIERICTGLDVLRDI